MNFRLLQPVILQKLHPRQPTKHISPANSRSKDTLPGQPPSTASAFASRTYPENFTQFPRHIYLSNSPKLRNSRHNSHSIFRRRRTEFFLLFSLQVCSLMVGIVAENNPEISTAICATLPFFRCTTPFFRFSERTNREFPRSVLFRAWFRFIFRLWMVEQGKCVVVFVWLADIINLLPLKNNVS